MKKFTISVVIFVAVLISISYGRTWTDNKGHTITAEYVSLVKLDEPKVRLLTPSGKNLLVPVRNLSKEDQEYIQKLNGGEPIEVPPTGGGSGETPSPQIKNVLESVVYTSVQHLNIDSPEARDALIQLREKDLTRIEPDYTIGLLYIFKKKDYLHAQQHFNRCQKINPNDAGTVLNLGTLCILQGKYPEALSFYQKAYALGGANKTLYNNLQKLIDESNARNIILSDILRKKIIELTSKVSGKTGMSLNHKHGWMFEMCSEGLAKEGVKCHWFQYRGYRPYEFPVCPRCNGTGHADCPDCTGGRVSYTVYVTRTFPDGKQVRMPTQKFKACSTCNGKGYLSCKLCKGSGHEFQLSRSEVEDYERQISREIADRIAKQRQLQTAENTNEQQAKPEQTAQSSRGGNIFNDVQPQTDKPETGEQNGGFAVAVQDHQEREKFDAESRRVFGVNDGGRKPSQADQEEMERKAQIEREEKERQAQIEREEQEKIQQQKANEERIRKANEEQKRQAIKARSIKAGDVGISIVNVKIGGVQIENEYSGRTIPIAGPYLIVDVLIDNQSTTNKIEFQSWTGGKFNRSSPLAELSDEFGNVYKQIDFGAGVIISGNKNQQSIYPESQATDRLVFQPPIKNAKVLTLVLPGKNFGDNSGRKAKIPFKTSDIEKESVELEEPDDQDVPDEFK